jgi:dTDP-4-amino-4,6-dideoxygalactose transaminase
MTTQASSKLAILGGPKAVTRDPGDLFTWPIITREDEDAVIAVLRAGATSGTAITKQFEADMVAWTGVPHALGCCNGTAGLVAALWACGVGAGDEIICPGMTYWASATCALAIGAAVNFADVDPKTLCIDPGDIEHRIGPRTRAIMAVHYAGHPCEMDTILAIARRHGLNVVEDVSHAQGGLYKGRMLGTLGDIAVMSLMGGKSLVAGEGGMILTRNRLMYERCVAFGHYERTGVGSRFNDVDRQITAEELTPYIGLPLGCAKHRMNQTGAALGRVQLKYYPQRIRAIQDALNRFWDALDGVPGLHPHRAPRDDGSTMGGWYYPQGLYRKEELGDLPQERFIEAVKAEGVRYCGPGGNAALHVHPLFHTADIFRMGKPTMVAFGQRDVRQGPGALPVSEQVCKTTLAMPWFKHDRTEWILEYAGAYRKVAEQAAELASAPPHRRHG